MPDRRRHELKRAPTAAPGVRDAVALRRARAAAGLLAGLLAGCAVPGAVGDPVRSAAAPIFRNAYPADGDRGVRAPAWYFLRRAWVQLTRDEDATPLPPTVPLDLAHMATRPFAVAWLGHSTLLIRAGDRWLLTDPVLSDYATSLPPFGPRRLTPLPLSIADLPRIDTVLVSHDHFDHLDLPTVRALAAQPGGPPRFLVGRGLGAWFAEHVGTAAHEFDWWDQSDDGALGFAFVPAQHSSGRSPAARNRTLWGGWVITLRGAGGDRRLYFAGDTAYSAPLFRDILACHGPFALAALPIGAYTPRAWMRFEHTDPAEALQAQADLGGPPAIGIHWATFQLGDEEPSQPQRDLEQAARQRGVSSFTTLPVGGWIDVTGSPPWRASSHATQSDAATPRCT